MKALAVDLSYDDRFLDHLAPLCELFSMPLLLTHEPNLALLDSFYPFVKTLYKEPSAIDYEKICKEYDLFFQSTFWKKDSFFYLFTKNSKEKKLIYIPHGDSDKGHEKPLLHLIKEQDLLFLYGDHMIERLKRQNLWDPNLPYLICGNYRRLFYEKNRSFYDDLAHQKIFSHLDPNNTTILYAPTWDDAEDSSSFFTLTKVLIEQLPPHINLLIKIHPMLFETQPAKAYLYANAKKKNLLIIENYPHIYSVLDKVDIYIGDFSSIGYDYLYYQRPMFFYDPQQRDLSHPSCFLHRCGYSIKMDDLKNIYGLITNLSLKEKQKIQQKIYHDTFGNSISLDTLREKFLALVINRGQDKKII